MTTIYKVKREKFIVHLGTDQVLAAQTFDDCAKAYPNDKILLIEGKKVIKSSAK